MNDYQSDPLYMVLWCFRSLLAVQPPDITGLPSGIYFVKVIPDDNVMVGRVIRE